MERGAWSIEYAARLARREVGRDGINGKWSQVRYFNISPLAFFISRYGLVSYDFALNAQ